MSENDNIFVTTEAPKKKKKGKAGKVIAIILLICIIGGLSAFGGVTLYNKYAPQIEEKGIGSIFDRSIGPGGDAEEELQQAETENSAQTPADVENPANEKPEVTVAEEPKKTDRTASDVLSAADIYEQNVNSTVGVTITGTLNYWGYQSEYAASGSGFIVTDDGYILTNYHVIEGSKSVTVTTYDDKSYDATVIGYDDDNDIAVLKIDGEGFVPVKTGNSDALRVGDDVYAIGNPLGELTFSLTQGIVSAKNRNVTMSDGTVMKLIQTDCAINSGNSGGALFNNKGEVVGITNAKYSSSGMSGEASIENIGFAIPINNVLDLVTSIVENGYIIKPYIGVTVSPVSDDVKNVTGIESGAMIVSVTEDGPAAKAGLQENDVITKVNGEPVDSNNDLVDIIASAKPGDVMDLEVYRQGEIIKLTVEIGERQESALENNTPNTSNQNPQQGDNDMFGYYFGNGGNGNGRGGNGGSSDDFSDYFGSFGDIFRYYFGY